MSTPEGWHVKSLSEVVSIQRGFDLPHHARRPGQFPVLTSGETGGFHDEGPIKGPGVTIGRATNLGKPKWSEGDFWPHNTTMFVKDFKGNLPRWVFHYFENTDLAGFDSGSVQPMLNRNYIAQVPVLVPPLEEQRAIAEVLGALDDKIAANTRLTQTLDNYFMARWSALSANDSLKQVKLTELVGDVIGGDWGNSESAGPSTEEVLCIRGADIADLQGSGLGWMPRRFIKPISLRRRKLAHMDLVVEMSGGSPTQSTGRVVLITDAMLERLPLPLSSSNFCRIVRLGKSQDAYFIYALLRESWIRGEFFQFENGSTGIKNLAFADFCSSKEVCMPEQSHLQGFNRLADGLFMQMQSLGEESARLRATRDTLLPQLMSGKLRVKDAEKVLENAGV